VAATAATSYFLNVTSPSTVRELVEPVGLVRCRLFQIMHEAVCTSISDVTSE